MGMTEAGISTTQALGQEQIEKCTFRAGGKRVSRYQYDYRDVDGTLFSCVKRTVAEARAERDRWLEAKREAARGGDRHEQELQPRRRVCRRRYVPAATGYIPRLADTATRAASGRGHAGGGSGRCKGVSSCHGETLLT